MSNTVKKNADKGFFDEENRREELKGYKSPLGRLNATVDWEMFRGKLEGALSKDKGPARGPGGRPSYDAVLMFKVLVLQKVYGLSDDNTELHIMDSLSAQAFLGLKLADDVPDAKTIWLYRENLVKAGVMKDLFELFKGELQSQGLELKSGMIVDATFVEVPRQRNKREENEQLKRGEIPQEWKEPEQVAKLRQKDTDARWTKKNDQNHYGYKNHVKVDQASKIIVKYVVTDAAVHDSQALEGLLQPSDEGLTVHGDSAYSGEPTAKMLRERQINNQIHQKGYRNHPLSEEQKESNRKKSKVRARVEHVFGFVCNSLGGFFMRAIGKPRNDANVGLLNMIYNMFRREQMLRLGVASAVQAGGVG